MSREKAIEYLKESICHSEMICCNNHKPEFVKERAEKLSGYLYKENGLLRQALAELEKESEPTEFTKIVKQFIIQKVGVEGVDIEDSKELQEFLSQYGAYMAQAIKLIEKLTTERNQQTARIKELKKANTELNIILFHRENGLGHPDFKAEIELSKQAEKIKVLEQALKGGDANANRILS